MSDDVRGSRAASSGASKALIVLLAGLLQASSALAWEHPWVQPHDAHEASERSDEYAWRLFVSLNWPADLRDRTPDPAAHFGADRPVVWESWPNASDVYRSDGRDPGPLVKGSSRPSTANEERFETISLTSLPNLRHVVAGRMVPLVDPVAAAKRLTEIHMNSKAFNYIRARELYNVEGQLRAVADGAGVHFPYGATEVKAKWRPINTEERARYHTVLVRLADGSTRLYGLTGLHLVSKDLPNWFWATFEHADNASLADGDGWKLPSRDRFACRGADADCKRAPHGIGLEGTVWSNYRLRGTLTQFVDRTGQPQRLANSELEAGVQLSSSCITCHSRSAIGVVAGVPMRLPIFAVRETSAAQDQALDRLGFLGQPRGEWFLDSGGQPLFQPLDFVWSLSKAQPRSRE